MQKFDSRIRRALGVLMTCAMLAVLAGCAQQNPANPLTASMRQQLRFASFDVSSDLASSSYLGDEPKLFEVKVRKAVEQRFASLSAPGAKGAAVMRFKVLHYWMPPAGLALLAGSVKQSALARAVVEQDGKVVANYDIRLDTSVGNLGVVIGAISNIDQGEDLAKQLVEVGYGQIMGD
jgi:hypothetical protein